MTQPDGTDLSFPTFSRFEEVADPAVYQPLPDDWALAMADVVSSTAAIAEGRYKSVNMAGAAVISAVLNAVGQKNLPFVFGGDGAFIAVPPGAQGQARTALADVATWVNEEMHLTLRVALVPLGAIRAANQDVRVARFQASTQVGYAMFAGGGASWAEAQMKQGTFAVPPAPAGARPDLTGLSCRWNPVTSRNGHIVSLILVPGSKGFDAAFRAFVAEVVALAAEGARQGNPVPDGGPPLKLSLSGVEAEARLQQGWLARMKTRLGVLILAALLIVLYRFNRRLGDFDAREYVKDIELNADFRKFDDGLKMTIDVTGDQLTRIEAVLKDGARQGLCRYGLHTQASALMTCIVPTPMTRDHMHFVDGGAGGYAEAARQMKAATAR